MPNENIVIFAGHLGKDAETKNTPSGVKYTKFSICSTKKWKQGNDWKEKQIWSNVLIWRNDFAENLKKGDGVVVIGELDYNVWTDKNQSKHYDNSILANKIFSIQKVEKKQPESKVEPKQEESIIPEPPEDDLPF